MATKVNLTLRVKTQDSDRYYPAVLAASGRVKQSYALHGGKEERFPNATYYIDWSVGSKRPRLSVGRDAAEAQNLRLKKEAELNATSLGIQVVGETGLNHMGLRSNEVLHYRESWRNEAPE
jgi:hypothetical protein